MRRRRHRQETAPTESNKQQQLRPTTPAIATTVAATSPHTLSLWRSTPERFTFTPLRRTPTGPPRQPTPHRPPMERPSLRSASALTHARRIRSVSAQIFTTFATFIGRPTLFGPKTRKEVAAEGRRLPRRQVTAIALLLQRPRKTLRRPSAALWTLRRAPRAAFTSAVGCC